MTRRLNVLVLLFALALPAFAQEEKLGKVTFPTSCDSKVQAQFERGVAMLHSYWFIQARKTFEAVLQQDPKCAMAYWGIAVDLLGNTLVGPPPAKNAQAAWEALEKARAIGAKTQRERDWIEALSAYYRNHDKVPVDSRLAAYTSAMEQLTRRYPDDSEAWVFYALTLQASAPKDDKTYANQLKSAAILEKLLQRDPQHPGVAHFLIHAYDYPPLAEKGLSAARRYAGEMGQAAPALREYEAALKENPNRYRAIYGAGRAAETAGDHDKAKRYFTSLVSLSKNADTERPELVRAKAFLARQ